MFKLSARQLAALLLVLLCLALTQTANATAELLYTFNAEDGTVGQAPPKPPLSAVTGPNIPIITNSPVYSGTKAYDVVLDRSQPNGWNPYRTEMKGSTAITLEFERSYWIGFAFRRTNWDTDTSQENFPFQVHERPSDWTNWGISPCTQSAASSAPITMINGSNAMQLRNLNTQIWSKPIDLNTWHTVILHVKWSKGNTGYVESWYDGVEQARKPTSGTTQTHRVDSAMDAYCGPNTTAKGDVTFIQPHIAAGVYKWDWKTGRPPTLTTLRRGTIDAIKIAQDVAGNDDAGGFALVNPGSAPADTSPPVLSAISESQVTESSATINWTTNEPANGRVEYGPTSAYGTLTAKASAFTTGHSIVISGLPSSAVTNYRIFSADAVGNLATGTNRTFTTASPNVAFSNVAAGNVSATGATITWNTPIQRKNDSINYGATTSYGSTFPASPNSALSTSHGLTLTGLTPSTTYNYKVNGLDSSNVSASSANFTFTTLPSIFNFVVDNITVDSARFTWQTTEPMTSTINYGTTTAYGGSRSNLSQYITSHEISLSPASGHPLTAGTLYHVNPCGITQSGGLTVCGADYTFTTATGGLAVSNIVVTTTKDSAAITWSTNQAADSLVTYGENNLMASSASDVALVTSHTINLTGLTPNRVYYYKIKSVNASGAEVFSNRLTFQTKTKSGLKSDPFSFLESWFVNRDMAG